MITTLQCLAWPGVDALRLMVFVMERTSVCFSRATCRCRFAKLTLLLDTNDESLLTRLIQRTAC